MASSLLLFVMMATVSCVFAAKKYDVTVNCATGPDDEEGCVLPKTILYQNTDYYDLDMIKAFCGNSTRCRGTLKWDRDRNRMMLQLPYSCNATFGIKKRPVPFTFKGVCGQDNNIPPSGFRIIEGKTAALGQFPWMAYVREIWPEAGIRQSCGGSIISDEWILTAGHCIIKQNGDGRLPPNSAMTVRTGSLDKWSDGIYRTMKRIVVHSNYSQFSLENDVGLLQLDEPIKWDGLHVPICLNKDPDVDKATKLKCRISGWGVKSNPGRNPIFPRKLLWADEVILSSAECKRVYGDFFTNTTFCGRATFNGSKGFCGSDSGGPMVCNQHGRYYQHGVVSLYKVNTVFCRLQGLYSSVAAFYDWITSYVPDVNMGLSV